MKVKVKLYTILKKYAEGKIAGDGTVILSEGSSLQGLSSYLDIPEKIAKVFLVNGIPRTREHVLEEGDEVKILSFIGGG